MEVLEVKSKFYSDFRRFSLDYKKRELVYEELYNLLEKLHGLEGIDFVIEYSHPVDGGILPINNNDNYNWAVKTCGEHLQRRPLIRLYLSRRGESVGEVLGYNLSRAGINLNSLGKGGGIVQRWELLQSQRNGSDSGSFRSNKSFSSQRAANNQPRIQLKDDFRVVSSIIDVDQLPVAYRRVRLFREDARPLGFFIRTGTSMRITDDGIERVEGIFISKLVPGGMAEMTGLIGVDDEVIEVNGIEVKGKTLDQVTDMMVANSSNLIITLKPASEKNSLLHIPRSKRQEDSGPNAAGDGSQDPSITATRHPPSDVALGTEMKYQELPSNSIISSSNKTVETSSMKHDPWLKNFQSSRNQIFSHHQVPLHPSNQFDLIGDVSLGDDDLMSYQSSIAHRLHPGSYEYRS